MEKLNRVADAIHFAAAVGTNVCIAIGWNRSEVLSLGLSETNKSLNNALLY
jgi:hypothetical protein